MSTLFERCARDPRGALREWLRTSSAPPYLTEAFERVCMQADDAKAEVERARVRSTELVEFGAEVATYVVALNELKDEWDELDQCLKNTYGDRQVVPIDRDVLVGCRRARARISDAEKRPDDGQQREAASSDEGRCL